MTYSFSTVLVHLEPLKEDSLSIKDKTAEFILSPTCPLFRGSTVYMYMFIELEDLEFLQLFMC